MMTTGGMLWGAALYNNGAYPHKDTRFGESYSARRRAARPFERFPQPTAEETRTKGILPEITPLERWEISQPGNVLRVFERGGGPKGEVGEPVRDDDRGQTRRQAQHARIRHASCAPIRFFSDCKKRACSIRCFPCRARTISRATIAPADARRATSCTRMTARRSIPRSTRSFGNRGYSATNDPTIPREESGHPIRHEFTRSIPSSQCMVCHVHPGTNMVTTYFGYTWWDNESDGDAMYPKSSAIPPRKKNSKCRSAIRKARRRAGCGPT